MALAYYLSIGLILVFTHGHFSAPHLVTLFGLHAAFSVAVLLRPDAMLIPNGRRAETFALVLLVCALLLSHDPHLVYPTDEYGFGLLQLVLDWLPLAAAILLGSLVFDHRALLIAAIVAVLGLLVAAKGLTLAASPSPHVDVFTGSQAAVEHLLSGSNPYSQSYPDIYGGYYDYRAGYPYWPGWLLWSAGWTAVVPAVWDVRVSLVAAEVISALCIAGLGRQLGLGWRGGAVAGLAWLAFPVGLFTLEQAWVDPLLVAAIAGAIWAATARRPLLAGLLLGYACATKQYAIFPTLFVLIFIGRTLGWRGVIRFSAGGLASFAALMMPFVAWDWEGLYRNTLQTPLSLSPRPDALTVPAFFAQGVSPSDTAALAGIYAPFRWLGLGLLVLVIVWTLKGVDQLTPRHLFAAIAVSLGFLLLFAPQAFCNYYYFLSFFVLSGALSGGAESSTEAVGRSAPD